MQYYAVTEIELMNFHIASILAGGKEEAKVVLDSIRKRKISYKNIEASNSADGKAGKVSLPEYREYNTTKSEIICPKCKVPRAHIAYSELENKYRCIYCNTTWAAN